MIQGNKNRNSRCQTSWEFPSSTEFSPPSTPPGFIKYYGKRKKFRFAIPETAGVSVIKFEVVDNENEDFTSNDGGGAVKSTSRKVIDYDEVGVEVDLEDEDERLKVQGHQTAQNRHLLRFLSLLLTFLACFLLLGSLVEFTLIQPSYGKSSPKGESDSVVYSITTNWSSARSLPLTSELKTEVRVRKLPEAIIIGARKCGTRALIDMLNLHPQVEKAALEVHFFDRDDNYGQGLQWYRAHMPETRPDQISIEKSPSYFITPEAPERIFTMSNSVKLLLIVREPVTRVISDYTQIYGANNNVSYGHKNGSKVPIPKLEDLVMTPDGYVNVHYKAIRISIYARYLQRWLDVFPLSQIHVIDGDALIRNPYPVLHEVERFLGLKTYLQPNNFIFNSTKGFYCWKRLDNPSAKSSNDFVQSQSPSNNNSNEFISQSTSNNSNNGPHCLNDSKGRPHPDVDPIILRKLRHFYSSHNLRFYEMVSRDFGWPDK